MVEPKLELKVKQQISALDLVKARATLRTKRRIAQQIEDEQMKELELQTAKEMSQPQAPKDKKGE